MTKRHDFHESLGRMGKDYRGRGRAGKAQMLDELGKQTGYHRKYLTALLNGRVRAPSGKRKRRARRYLDQTIELAYRIWLRTGRPCAQLLVADMAMLARHAPKHIKGCTPEALSQLVRISASQLWRRMAGRVRKLRRKSNGWTARSRQLRHQVPVSTSRPPDPAPGLLENDTVAHCGGSMVGGFIWTLNSVDIASGWVCAAPVLGTAASHMVPAMEGILERMPFDVWEVHSDNGSEFINYHMVRLCEQRGIEMTRGRPYRHNDNSGIEQKNWTHVRRTVGYRRMESKRELALLREVYRVMETLFNLFVPTAKLESKSREDGKVRRRMGPARPPVLHLEAYYLRKGLPVPERVRELLALRETLDPFELHEQLEDAVNALHAARKEAA